MKKMLLSNLAFLNKGIVDQLIQTAKLIREKITKPIRDFQLSFGGNTE